MLLSTLTFDIEPVPASRPRVSKFGTYYNPKYEQFRRDMGKLLLGVKRTAYTEMLKTDVTFYIKLPASMSKKQKDELDGTPCDTNIDLDNLEKAVYDSMNGHVFEDDRQIVEHSTRKIWVKENPRIQVIISNYK